MREPNILRNCLEKLMRSHRHSVVIIIFLFSAIIFSLFTAYIQYRGLSLAYLEKDRQIKLHREVLQGEALGHWQYRILSEYVVEGVLIAVAKAGISRHPIVDAFVIVRVIQNISIFFLVGMYYKNLGLSTYTTLLGFSILAWAMTHSLYDSDLQFSTYSDIIFYLVAGLVILQGKDMWIIPVTGLAALNRETSGLIPFMFLAHCLASGVMRRKPKRCVSITMLALGLYAAVFFGLRYAYGSRPPFHPYGHHFGFDILVYNFGRRVTWVQLFATLSILPIMAIYSFRRWPRTLQAFFWVIVPIWFLIHPFVGVIAETRLFLVPLSVVFIPGVLFGIRGPGKDNDCACDVPGAPQLYANRGCQDDVAMKASP